MIVAVPAELLASPLKSGRNLGDADRSALVIGGTEKIRARGAGLLSLFRVPDKDNYPDAAVMPMFAVRGGPAAGQGGALAA